MSPETGITGLVSPKAIKQVEDMIARLTQANEVMGKAIITASEYYKVLANSKGLTDLQANYNKTAIASEKVRKAHADAELALLKLSQAQAKAAADFDKAVQREIENQNKRAAAEESRARAVVKAAKDSETAREKERLAELKQDADRKKRFDAYEAQLKRKANAEARDAAQAARQNAIIENNSRAYRKLSLELETARRKAQDIGVTFGITSVEFQRASRQVNELDTRLKAVDRSLGVTKNSAQGLTGVIGNLTAMAGGMAAGFLSATALISSAFNTALRTDAIKTSLEFTFGSIDVADEKIAMLKKTAERLGLEYVSLADSYRSFAGAAVASNFSIKETDRIFGAVANAGAKLKLTSDQVTGALNALQQMISKGTVQSEELRGQLGERLPGAFAIAARAMGVTTQELGKMLKDGKVLAADLLPKLADELDKTFSNDKNEKVSSLQGSVNDLKNSFTDIVETKGALKTFFTYVVDSAGLVVKSIAKMSEALGIFYDLATSPKKFVLASAKGPRAESNALIQQQATGAAADVAKDAGSKTALFDRTNSEAMLLKVLADSYKNLKTEYDKTAEGDRTLTATKRLQDANQALIYQIQFVRTLRSEYQTLYGQAGIKELADNDLTSVKAIQARINELKKLEGSAIIGSEIYKRIENLQSRLAKPKTGAKDTSAKDALNVSKAVLEGEKSAVKRVIDDETIDFDIRIAAVDKYYKKSQELLENDKQIQLTAAELTANQKLAIQTNINNKMADLDAESKDLKEKILKEELTEGENNRRIANQKEINSIMEEEAKKLDFLNTAYENGAILEEDYGKEKLKIQQKYAKKLVEQEIQQLEEMKDSALLTNDQRAEADKKLAELRLRLSNLTSEGITSDSDAIVKAEKENADKRLKLEEELKDKKEQLQTEIQDLAISLVNASFDNQKNQVQKEIDFNDEKKQRDIENVNNSLLSEQEKADKIAVIEAQSMARREQLERRQREIDIQRQRFQKLAAVAEIAINTAKDVAKIVTGAAALNIIPVIGQALSAKALAQIPFVLAISAAQIAAIAATPIAAYKDGTRNSKKGLALTDEVGAELYIPPSGEPFLGSDVPNIKNLQAGTRIIPHDQLIKILANPEPALSHNGANIDLSPLLKSQNKGFEKIAKALKERQPPIISKHGLYASTKYLNKLYNWQARNGF